jgi:hypothetical protein
VTRDDTADRLAIIDLEARYARTFDSCDPEGWAACFTPDGALEMSGVGGHRSRRIEGRAALADFCRHFNARYDSIHMPHLPELTIDGDTARGWVHWQYFDANRETGERRHVVGVYAVTYHRLDEGWRFHVKRERVFSSDEMFAGYPSTNVMWSPDLG